MIRCVFSTRYSESSESTIRTTVSAKYFPYWLVLYTSSNSNAYAENSFWRIADSQSRFELVCHQLELVYLSFSLLALWLHATGLVTLTKRLGNHIVLFGIDSIWGNPHWAFLDADYELVCQLADSKKFSKPDWKLDALQVSYAIYVVLECIFHPFDADSMADGPIERPPVFAFVFMAKQTHNSRPWLAEW